MFQDNGDQVVLCGSQSGTTTVGCSTADINAADNAVTFTETGANTGIFTNWDDSLVTNMYINPSADRGTQSVSYTHLTLPTICSV